MTTLQLAPARLLATALVVGACFCFAAESIAAEPGPDALSGDADALSGDAAHWSRFRGPQGTGLCVEQNLPVEFNASDVVWQTDLPVKGHSSPVVWGQQIFLTGATQTGQAGDSIERHVICLARDSGKVLWNQVAGADAGEPLHKMNSWATPSCATDGERVVAFFGAGGLHCFDTQGKPIWSRDLGTFPGKWGVGASPIIVDQMVIQNCDAEGDSYLLAVDKKTGNDIWRTPRESKPRGGWSTPVVIEVGGHRELVLNGEFGVDAYDPTTGEHLWNCKGFNGRGTPSPVWGNGLLYVVNGKSGDVYAVRPGGRGDVTAGRMQWHTDRRGGRDLPSPILVGDHLLVVNMTGIATAYDAFTGDEIWKERLGGNYSGSPVAAGGLVYALAENGDVVVIKPAKEFELVARNSFGAGDEEVFRSSIGISNGQLLIRSDRRLYCVGTSR